MMVILFRSRTWLCLFLLLIWHILCVWVCVCACRPTVQCCVLANYQSCCSKKMVFPKGNTDFMSTIHMWGEESCTQARINMFHLLMNTWNRVCEQWRWRRLPLPPPFTIFCFISFLSSFFSSSLVLQCFILHLSPRSVLFCLQLTMEVWLLEAQGGFFREVLEKGG